jgi:hypothetical protein
MAEVEDFSPESLGMKPFYGKCYNGIVMIDRY